MTSGDEDAKVRFANAKRIRGRGIQPSMRNSLGTREIPHNQRTSQCKRTNHILPSRVLHHSRQLCLKRFTHGLTSQPPPRAQCELQVMERLQFPPANEAPHLTSRDLYQRERVPRTMGGSRLCSHEANIITSSTSLQPSRSSKIILLSRVWESVSFPRHFL